MVVLLVSKLAIVLFIDLDLIVSLCRLLNIFDLMMGLVVLFELYSHQSLANLVI
jgi:hypothetical protein